jgi:hypothetical protein
MLLFRLEAKLFLLLVAPIELFDDSFRKYDWNQKQKQKQKEKEEEEERNHCEEMPVIIVYFLQTFSLILHQTLLVQSLDPLLLFQW